MKNAVAASEQAPAGSLPVNEDARFRLLVEAVTDYAIYMIDPAGVVSSWNPGAQRSKGYLAHEIIGQHFSAFYTKEDKAAGKPQRALEIAAREGRFETEGWRIRKDGSRFWAHVVLDPIRTPEGGLIGYAKITRDLTDQKRASELLRQSEEQFRLLVQGVSDYAICMLDPTGMVTNWNQGAHRIKGYQADEIVGQHFSKFYTPEDRANGEPQRALETAAREGRYEKEAQRVRKDGTRFFAHVVIDPIRNELGEIIGFAKITRDVTERVKQQKELEEAREAFFQAQKMESLGQLTGGIAHDFNNLLMAVLSSLELLRKRLPEDARSLQLLDNAVQGAERGAALTQRMLAFARRQALTPLPTDIGGLVRGVEDLILRTLGPHVRLETHIAAEVRHAVADAPQLELALINLAANARDSMTGGGAVTVFVREAKAAPGDPVLAPGDYVVVGVTDRGEGMDEETLSRATEPFFTTKGVGRGTGLGLSMVSGFAEQLSGGLKLKSRKGEGTTAEIWLPVASAAQASAPGRAKAATPEASASKAELTVLAVDDDALVLMNTTAMLEDLGHTVIEAVSGAEALELLDRHPEIDVVITDYAMPRMTGRDLITAIHAKRPGLPAILATGYAELPAGDVVDALRLPKPFNEPDIARILAVAAPK